MKILITNLSYHASNDIIKEIRRSKFSQTTYIVGSSIYPFGFTSASLFVDKFINQPSFFPEIDYVNFIQETCKKFKIDLIFAIDEDEIKILSKYKEKVSATLIIPSYETLDLFCNKKKANDKLSSLNFNIPKYIATQDDLKNIPSGKIITRKCESCASLGIKIYNVNEKLDIKSLYTSDNIVQEFIQGTEYCVDVFCDRDCSPKLIVPRKRVAIRGGTTHKCLIERNEDLIALSQKICCCFDLPGITNMQFLIENETSKIYFLEVNPRMGATTIATGLAATNLIEMFIDHFCYNAELKSLEYYMNQVKWGSFISRYYCETICEEYI